MKRRAVVSKVFIDLTKQRLDIRARGPDVVGIGGTYHLREPAAPYKGNFDPEKSLLRLENIHIWTDSV